jgi:hypothetical protein
MNYLKTVGPLFYFKASEQQKEAADQNQAFTTQLQGMFTNQFQNAQNIQGALNAQLQSITNQGLAGRGLINGEEAALRTNSTENQAQANVQGQRALQARVAQTPLTGGALGQIVGQQTANNAAQNAAAQRNITLLNANLARQNVGQGLSGLTSLSGQEAGLAGSVGGMAVNNASNSYNEVTQAHQPSNFWGNLAGGVVGGALNMVAPGIGSSIGSSISNGINGPANVPTGSASMPTSYSGPSGGGSLGLAGDLGFGTGMAAVNGPSQEDYEGDE